MTLPQVLKAGLVLTWTLMLLFIGLVLASVFYDWRPNPFPVIFTGIALSVARHYLSWKLKQTKVANDHEQLQ